jgi:hypothetical protein
LTSLLAARAWTFRTISSFPIFSSWSYLMIGVCAVHGGVAIASFRRGRVYPGRSPETTGHSLRTAVDDDGHDPRRYTASAMPRPRRDCDHNAQQAILKFPGISEKYSVFLEKSATSGVRFVSARSIR